MQGRFVVSICWMDKGLVVFYIAFIKDDVKVLDGGSM